MVENEPAKVSWSRMQLREQTWTLREIIEFMASTALAGGRGGAVLSACSALSAHAQIVPLQKWRARSGRQQTHQLLLGSTDQPTSPSWLVSGCRYGESAPPAAAAADGTSSLRGERALQGLTGVQARDGAENELIEVPPACRPEACQDRRRPTGGQAGGPTAPRPGADHRPSPTLRASVGPRPAYRWGGGGRGGSGAEDAQSREEKMLRKVPPACRPAATRRSGSPRSHRRAGRQRTKTSASRSHRHAGRRPGGSVVGRGVLI